MAEGYYDYWPSRPLERTIVLSGIDNGLVRRVAFAISSLNGWRVSLIDDLLQHQWGMDASALGAEFGHRERDLHCERALDSAWSAGPPGVVALPARWLPRALRRPAGTGLDATIVLVESSDEPRTLDELPLRVDGILRVSKDATNGFMSERIHAILDDG
ncbi:MAG: hypothetical protein AAF654_04275 [Myxococcota bacterium]